MSAATAILTNAVSLIGVSIWAYLGSGAASATALIPSAFGVLLLACYPGVRSERPYVRYIAVILTVMVLVALTTPLRGALAREDALAIVRVGLMMATTLIAFGFLIKAIIDARKKPSS